MEGGYGITVRKITFLPQGQSAYRPRVKLLDEGQGRINKPENGVDTLIRKPKAEGRPI